MSNPIGNPNKNKPTLGSVPLPPPPPMVATTALSPESANLLAKYPLPWVIGPYGDVWVAADVEMYDPEKESGEKIAGPNGTWWRTAKDCPKPRHVFDAENLPRDITALIVETMNALGAK